jgi:hypothetical protein
MTPGGLPVSLDPDPELSSSLSRMESFCCRAARAWPGPLLPLQRLSQPSPGRPTSASLTWSAFRLGNPREPAFSLGRPAVARPLRTPLSSRLSTLSSERRCLRSSRRRRSTLHRVRRSVRTVPDSGCSAPPSPSLLCATPCPPCPSVSATGIRHSSSTICLLCCWPVCTSCPCRCWCPGCCRSSASEVVLPRKERVSPHWILSSTAHAPTEGL